MRLSTFCGLHRDTEQVGCTAVLGGSGRWCFSAVSGGLGVESRVCLKSRKWDVCLCWVTSDGGKCACVG
jgi:hypothetical protein